MSTGQPHGDRRQIFATTHQPQPPSALNYVLPGSFPADDVSPAQKAHAMRLIFGAIVTSSAVVLLIRCFKFAVLSFEVFMLVAVMSAVFMLGKALVSSTLFHPSNPRGALERDRSLAFSIPIFLQLTVAIALTDFPIVCMFLLFAAVHSVNDAARVD